jgi:hypothetical protein
MGLIRIVSQHAGTVMRRGIVTLALSQGLLALSCSPQSRDVRREESESRAIESIKKLGGKITRDEKKYENQSSRWTSASFR